jgi:hypothetical protein
MTNIYRAFLQGRKARLLLATLLCSAGLTAAAQTITPASNSAACNDASVSNPGGVAFNATGLSYTFTPAPGQTFVGWGTRGDFQITSASTANPVTVSSTGYGRAQIVAFYSVGGCNPIEASYTVNKTFTVPNDAPLVGPVCVLPGGEYTWSIKPLISSANQIAARIGIDTYTWDVVAVNGTPPTLPAQTPGAEAYSGDFSAVRLTMPSNVGTFKLRLKVGACNTFQREITVSPIPPKPVFVSPPSCRPSSDTSPFNLTISSLAGVTYTWNVPPTWTISPANATTGLLATGATQTVSITPDANGGDVTVTASNGGTCGSQTERFTLKRQLNPAVSTITNVPACFTLNQQYNLGVSGAANNSTFTWSIPAGFTGNGVAGPITVTTPTPNILVSATGSSNATISVTSDGCGGGVVSALLRVSGTNGCTFSLTDLDCATIRVNATSGTGCLPTTGTTYVWETPGNPTQTTTTRTVSFPNNVNGTVTVTITNPSTCLRVVVSAPFNSPLCAGRPASGGASSPAGAVNTFPNPTGGKLNVDLPLKGGEQATLVLTDIAGRQQLQTTTQQAHGTIDLGRLPNGVYTLRAELPNGKVVTQKVVIRH